MSTLEAKSQPRPPCAKRPDDWDLDTGTPTTWRQAVATCHSCPLLTPCRTLAKSLIARGQTPRSMIWAAVGYDNAGNVIPDLDRHRTTSADHKRPTMVIRTAIPYRVRKSAMPTPAAAVSGRRIVIHRGQR